MAWATPLNARRSLQPADHHLRLGIVGDPLPIERLPGGELERVGDGVPSIHNVCSCCSALFLSVYFRGLFICFRGSITRPSKAICGGSRTRDIRSQSLLYPLSYTRLRDFVPSFVRTRYTEHALQTLSGRQRGPARETIAVRKTELLLHSFVHG